MSWTDAFDVAFPVAWWDADGNTVYVEATGVVRLRTTDAGASYLVYVHVPDSAASVAPDAVHTLGGVAGFRVQRSLSADGSSGWLDWNFPGYVNGWRQDTVPRRVLDDQTFTPNGGAPGAIRVQVLQPTPAGTPTGAVSAEVTTLAVGGATLTVGDDFGPRTTSRLVPLQVPWRRQSDDFVELVDSLCRMVFVQHRGELEAVWVLSTTPPAPTGWTRVGTGQTIDWGFSPGSSGNTRWTTITISSDLSFRAYPTNGHKALAFIYLDDGVAVQNRAELIYDGTLVVTSGNFLTPTPMETLVADTLPRVTSRLRVRVGLDGGPF